MFAEYVDKGANFCFSVCISIDQSRLSGLCLWKAMHWLKYNLGTKLGNSCCVMTIEMCIFIYFLRNLYSYADIFLKSLSKIYLTCHSQKLLTVLQRTSDPDTVSVHRS